MCARFTLAVPDLASLARMLSVDVDPGLAALYHPRYNVAPSTRNLVLRAHDGRRQLVPATWGLVNRWARPGADVRIVNARAEGARTKPAFRSAFAQRRCVIPADGFFEWTGPKGARRPIWFHPAGGGLLHLAGLYEEASEDAAAGGTPERTFTILTTDANARVAPVHDRMPAILAPKDLDAWLSVDVARPEEAEALLRPAPLELLAARAVSPRVNSVTNDDPSLLQEERAERAESGEQLSLFGPAPRR